MKKYGFLDPRPLDEEEEQFLKCEDCGLEYDNKETPEDYESIEETGKCLDCNN